MRVAFTIEQCWHRVPGGTAVAAIGMARAVTGHELVGVAAAHRHEPAEPWVPPIAVRHLPLPRSLLYRAWHLVRRPRVEGATGKVDVIHATTIAIPPRTAPLVVTIHDLAFVHDPSHFTPRGIRFFRRGLELAREQADLVLCPSEATKEDCLAQGFDGARLRVVPLGVDAPAATATAVTEVRRRYELDGDYILWTGTVEPRKNLPLLLAAFGALDHDVRLVLAGPQGWNEDLDAAIASSRAQERVRVLGFVPSSDLHALYAGARVFCFPSLREGFGFPVLEAMAQGTPVITSSGTSTEELAGNAALLVDPRDREALRLALDELLGDEQAAARLGAAGRKRAARFTWARTGEMLSAVYEELGAA